MAERSERLYGTVGAEEMYLDPAEVYESDIEPWHEPSTEARIEVEEHDVHPPRYHLPTVDCLLEWVSEWACDMGEVGEGYVDHMEAAIAGEDVQQAADALLDLIAARIPYRMANKHLRSLWVTWDENGEPLLDGEPMYRPAAEAPHA